MRQRFITLDADGLVAAVGFGLEPPAGAVIVGNDVSQSVLMRSYIDGPNGLVERPASPQMIRTGNVFSLAASPAGTRILVSDISGQEIMLDHLTAQADEVLEIELVDIGSYQFEITAPLPYMPGVFEVQV